MKICIARLRSGTNYVEPLVDIIDSFCECLKHFVRNHTEHTFTYYNFGFNQKPQRNIQAIADADVIIIPSEAEFTYHIPGYIHSLDVKRSNEHIDSILKHIEGKKIIILRSDRRDDEELYRTKVFANINNNFDYDEIDEIDFQNNIHSLKYYFIKQRTSLMDDTSYYKAFDFAYWGTDKRKGIDGKLSGDERHKILKQIKQSSLSTRFIGRFYGFQRDEKFQKMVSIIPTLKMTRCTLCFNWLSNVATTSRYTEAIACGIIPFVWEHYDSTGIFVKNNWQRVFTIEDFVDKVQSLRYDVEYEKMYDLVHRNFLEDLLPMNEYISQFDSMLTGKL